MVRPLDHGGDTIYRSFTAKNPQSAVDEIKTFAGKSDKVGRRAGFQLGLFDFFRAA
jgi:hypothetical protein